MSPLEVTFLRTQTIHVKCAESLLHYRSKFFSSSCEQLRILVAPKPIKAPLKVHGNIVCKYYSTSVWAQPNNYVGQTVKVHIYGLGHSIRYPSRRVPAVDLN